MLPYSNECFRSEYLPKGKRRATASPSYVFADPGARLKLLEDLLLISFVITAAAGLCSRNRSPCSTNYVL